MTRIPYKDLQRMDKAERKKTLKETTKKIEEILNNKDGLQRLKAITDDEWNAALADDATL